MTVAPSFGYAVSTNVARSGEQSTIWRTFRTLHRCTSRGSCRPPIWSRMQCGCCMKSVIRAGYARYCRHLMGRTLGCMVSCIFAPTSPSLATARPASRVGNLGSGDRGSNDSKTLFVKLTRAKSAGICVGNLFACRLTIQREAVKLAAYLQWARYAP